MNLSEIDRIARVTTEGFFMGLTGAYPDTTEMPEPDWADDDIQDDEDTPDEDVDEEYLDTHQLDEEYS